MLEVLLDGLTFRAYCSVLNRLLLGAVYSLMKWTFAGLVSIDGVCEWFSFIFCLIIWFFSLIIFFRLQKDENKTNTLKTDLPTRYERTSLKMPLEGVSMRGKEDKMNFQR